MTQDAGAAGQRTASSLTSGPLRSLIVMHGMPSIFVAFRDRTSTISIPRTAAVAPAAKMRTIPLPKTAQAASATAAIIDAADAVIVDLGNPKKVTPAAYGAVFTSEPDDGPCWHCRRNVKPERKVGIPLRIRDDRFHHLLIVDIEGRACHAGCAYKFIKDHVAEHACYEGRMTAMQQINEICAPGTKLVAAPDWRLHQMNGGPFSDEQFDKEMRTFAPTPSLQFRLCSLTFGPS